MGDTGLLLSHAFDENELMSSEIYKQILNDELHMNEGMLFENVIAQKKWFAIIYGTIFKYKEYKYIKTYHNNISYKRELRGDHFNFYLKISS